MALSAALAAGDISTAATASGSGATTQGVAAPTNLATGNALILATVNGNPTSAITGPTGGVGSGWTNIFNGEASDDLRFAVWYKLAAGASDVGATFTVTTAGSAIPWASACLRIPGVDTSGVRASGANQAGVAGSNNDATTAMAPTAMAGVLSTDLAFEIYGFSQHTAAALTLTYATQGTWTQIAKPTTGSGSSAFNSGLVIIAKLGGGLTGDPSTQPTSNVTGSWGAVQIALKAAAGATDKFMPFFV